METNSPASSKVQAAVNDLLAPRIGTRQLAQMCHRVGTSLHAGIDVRRIWATEANHGSAQHRKQLAEVSRRIAAGETLTDSLQAGNGYFPPLAVEMVEVGEQTGRLEQVFLRLADHYNHVLELRRQFLTGIAWPALQLSMAIVVIGGLIWLLGVLTGGAASVFGLSGTSGLMKYMTVVFLIFGSLAFVILGLARGWFGPTPFRLAMQIPGLGGAIRTMALANFSWSLAMTLDSGVDARRALRMSLRSTQNPVFRDQVETCEGLVLKGLEFHEILRSTGVFPDEFLIALETAEVSGTQSESLFRLAADYQERAKTAFRFLTMVATFLTWATVAAILVAMIISLFMKLYLEPMREALDMIK